jgi:hypothetical protein
MNMSAAQSTSTGAPVVNVTAKGLSALTGAQNLASLIEAFRAAERAIITADDAEVEIKATLPKPAHPRVFGGITPASTLIVEGRPTVEMEASEWFYTSRESIEKDRAIYISDAKTDAERDGVAARFQALLADWDAQQETIDKAIPKGLRSAARKLEDAYGAYTPTKSGTRRNISTISRT